MADRPKAVNVDFGFTEEGYLLVENLNKYRKSLGLTWQRVLLVGMAKLIDEQGDNPDLILQISDFIER